jgi:hypothetical protein
MVIRNTCCSFAITDLELGDCNGVAGIPLVVGLDL